MVGYTQDKRHLKISTPLGKDVLLLAKLSGREEMSRLFEFELELLSEHDSLKPEDLIGRAVDVTIVLPGQDPLPFNGIVRRFVAGGRGARGMRSYRAEVVPWLWLLTRTADCRIFQKMTTPKIIEKIFSDLGFTDFSLKLSGSYQTRDYCVQYRETDFHFVSRLMEEEGIFYWFRHQAGKHTLYLGDAVSAYEVGAQAEVSCSGRSHVNCRITGWEHGYEFRPGKYAQTDYDFEKPSLSLMSKEDTLIDQAGFKKFEVYEYPGLFVKKDHGRAYTRLRMEEEEAPYDKVAGAGNCGWFAPGIKFTAVDHEIRAEDNKGYVLTGVQHSACEEGYETGQGAPKTYENTFICIPDRVVARPTWVTRKPTVLGTQTAVVVGPKGEEIYTDKYGRIKVQFHWDREGKKDENSSCWIRVTQPWAGKRWGGTFIPRIGQEVIVDFLEGDPDRPLVVGTVYNGEQMPPYLGGGPDGKHANDPKVSGIKTNSTKGGSGYNEIRFDDNAGKEEVFIHGEKDLDLRLKNDRREFIGHDTHLEVKNNRHEKIGKLHTEEVGEEIHIKCGQKIVIEATVSISLVVGPSFIHLTPAGITIDGPMVWINSGGAGPAKGTPAKPDPADDSASGSKSS